MSLEKFLKEHRDTFEDKKMPNSAKASFESRLKEELHQDTSNMTQLQIVKYLSIAASITLLVTIGYWFQNRQEDVQVRDNLVLALNESETNSSRLETIYEIEDQFINEKEDEKILNAFFKILKSDSDANSKIAVIDALLKFPDNAVVRLQLIDALGNETEPLVQLKLIKSVAILREKRAKAPLKKIIKDEESLPLVKGNASALLAMLNQ